MSGTTKYLDSTAQRAQIQLIRQKTSEFKQLYREHFFQKQEEQIQLINTLEQELSVSKLGHQPVPIDAHDDLEQQTSLKTPLEFIPHAKIVQQSSNNVYTSVLGASNTKPDIHHEDVMGDQQSCAQQANAGSPQTEDTQYTSLLSKLSHLVNETKEDSILQQRESRILDNTRQ